MPGNWDGNTERRKSASSDHDVLIRIDEKLDNFKTIFLQHVAQDEEAFRDHKSQLMFLQRGYWMTIGAIVIVELIFKFFK